MTKRSVVVAGHRTSVSVEDPFWDGLAAIAAAKGSSVTALIETIDRQRTPATNLSAAVRLHVLEWYRRKAG